MEPKLVSVTFDRRPAESYSTQGFSYVAFGDLDFTQHALTAYSSRGNPYTRWIPVGMPRIPAKILDCVCYLYASEEDARAGEKFGGSGFLVGVSSPYHPAIAHIYVVTNHHIACTEGASVVRFNTTDGGNDIYSFDPSEWDFDPRYDIACLKVSLDAVKHKISLLPIEMLSTHEEAAQWKYGAGEDVFMVGRFVDHDGGVVNRPAVRFGNISVMPSPVEQPSGVMADAYCIDLHSRSGYSGSPVFIYRTPGFDMEEMFAANPKDRTYLVSGIRLLKLLGIHFAQFPEEWEIRGYAASQVAPESASSVPLIKEGKYVKGLSGMTCVLPAAAILELLNSPKNVMARKNLDDLAEVGRLTGITFNVPSPENFKQ